MDDAKLSLTKKLLQLSPGREGVAIPRLHNIAQVELQNFLKLTATLENLVVQNEKGEDGPQDMK